MWSTGSGAASRGAPSVPRGRPERPSCVRVRRSRFPGPGQVDAVLAGDPPYHRRVETGPVRLAVGGRRCGLGRGRRPPAAGRRLRHRLGGSRLRFMVLGGVGLTGPCRRVDLGQQRAHRNGVPGFTRMRSKRPLAGEGISTSTLSVVTSHTGSSASTQSPGCLRHSTIVPSATETPIWGIRTDYIPRRILRCDVRGGRVCCRMRLWLLSRRGAHGTPPSCPRAEAGPPAPEAG